MNKKYWLLIAIVSVVALALLATGYFATGMGSPRVAHTNGYTPQVTKSDAEWKKILTAEQYAVLRQGGTDIPFTHEEMLHEKRPGTYVTADCGEPVFRSDTKFDSGTGWPSFWAPIEGSVAEISDTTLGMERVEIVGRKCGGHLGHVFDDGPAPTGKRYCINASALKFIPDP